MLSPVTSLLILAACSQAVAAHGPLPYRPRCAFGDPCWPSLKEWQSFNESISGRLIVSHPSAVICHQPLYNPILCKKATEEWTNSFWRTDQVGAYSAILWEDGNDQCDINTPVNEPCGPGLVAHYSVAAEDTSDIQAAIHFALRHDIYLVIKNTGHDHLGRSSGRGSLAIWTHRLKGRTWHDAFTPSGAPSCYSAVPAVTLRAGEQWLDVYRDADMHNRIVVGGSARTVGAAGGYLTGGGHSAWAHFYGLAADNLLEVTIVTPTGELKIINEHTDPDYFWAIRGGGGSTWGVITSVTYKTHPSPSHIQVGISQFNTTTDTARRTVIQQVLKSLVYITDSGYTGYGSITPNSLRLIFIQPNGTNATYDSAFASLQQLANVTGVAGGIFQLVFPSWLEYGNVFLQDPNIATNVQDASRLLTKDILLNKHDQLADLVLQYPDLTPGFNFIGKVNSAERDKTSVHDTWRNSHALMTFGIDFVDNATLAYKHERKERLVEISSRMSDIVGPDSGTYVNEANPYEPKWQTVFWGKNYVRLLKIKRRVDPANLLVCNRCVGTDVIYEP
ncbi:FAD-binding domain-containing protein [Rhizodiscina lignyota]|uniref:FAD-binding domain-containing protein n=1 Tax=Rhizodiscina lignyota TaxID=1504668 RepID=A0A9P4I5E3_9PEZI|nr:FAD-binding domain-containing protein [Rhizodiscina lignyota]